MRARRFTWKRSLIFRRCSRRLVRLAKALEEGAGLSGLRQAFRERDVPALKEIWDRLIPIWDDRSFYDFVATSYAFADRPFQYREVFGQVGFGTGGWDSDYPNSMLEILRVVAQLRRESKLHCGRCRAGTAGALEIIAAQHGALAHRQTRKSLHGGAPRPGVTRIDRAYGDKIAVTDRWGDTKLYDAVLVALQSWLLTTYMKCEESCFRRKCGWRWTARAICNRRKIS